MKFLFFIYGIAVLLVCGATSAVIIDGSIAEVVHKYEKRIKNFECVQVQDKKGQFTGEIIIKEK